MSRSTRLASFLTAAILLAPAGLAGQAIPRTEVFEIEPPASSGSAGISYDHHALGALVVPGGFAVYWSTSFSPRTAENAADSIHGRLIDVNGRLGARLEPDSTGIGELESLSAARERTGEILFAWSAAPPSQTKGEVWMQRLASSGEPAGECQRLSNWRAGTGRAVVASGGGNSVVAWIERSQDDRTAVKAGLAGAGGAPAIGEILVDDSPYLLDQLAAGVDAGGRFVILWGMREQNDPYCIFVGQRFAPDGTRLGERFTVARQWSIKGCPQRLSLAMAPDGSFAVAWRDWWGNSVVERFAPDGAREGLGASFAVTSSSLAGDRHGNLAWMLPGIQLFNRYMVSHGVVWPGPPRYGDPIFLALGSQLLAVWSGPLTPGARPSVLGQIWDLRRDADACAYRGNRFLCDTAGDGGETDVHISFGSGQGIPLMGDFNGDGRDDPCLYRDSRFVCDTAHDGAVAEKKSPRFGQPGDEPLLGDLDGDGRDDPCVRRGKTFLCDADRNGRTDRSITFGLPGDQAVMGDVDGDGRDDPCVVRKGAFLCDSVHNGSAAETQLSLSAGLSGFPTGTPALGDIDGDGRDDPCVFTAGRLLCGLFPKGAKLPASIVDRPFGEPGDAFLLGDLDAF